MNYKKIYDELIAKRKAEVLDKGDVYCETHHIIPKSEGGSDDESNKVNLAAREHYIAHLLLAKIYDDFKMYSALVYMRTSRHKNRAFRINGHLYAKMREEFGRKLAITKKGVSLGPCTEEHKKAIAEAHKGIQLSDKHKLAIANGLTGTTQTIEHRNAIGASRKCFKCWTNGIVQKFARECPGPEFVNMTLRKWKRLHK